MSFQYELQDRKRRAYDEVHAEGRWGERSGSNDRSSHRQVKREPTDNRYRDEHRDNRNVRPRPVKEEPEDHSRREREDREPRRDNNRRRDEDNFREQRRERSHHDRNRRQNRRRRNEEEDDNQEWGRADVKEEKPPEEKTKPNFELSGKLTEDTNVFKGVVIKYNEPPEARKPKRRWRLYPFKGEEQLPVLYVHRQSAYLLGRDRKVADIPTDHPSCSKQHAVLQFRLVEYDRPDGTRGRRVRPYVIDLNSANGTFVNNQQIDTQRYVELLEKDVVKFGFSSREYVLMHDKVDTSELEDEGE